MRYYLLIFLSFFFFSCGKKKSEPSNTTIAPVTCNLQVSSLVVNDSVNIITADTSFVTSNNTYYIQQQVSNTKGCSFDFGGTEKPTAGTYTITSNYTEIIPGAKKVYIQYFIDGESYQGQAGNVIINASNTITTLEYCKIDFKNSFNQGYKVSFKGILH